MPAPSIETAQAWQGRTMVDPAGDKLGTIDAIYLDDETGQPEWATVTSGLFGTKYCRMEVRAWLGAGWWALILPGGGVVEVQPAGAVQGFFRGAGVQAGWQDGVLVAVAAGEVDGKAPPAGRPAVA